MNELALILYICRVNSMPCFVQMVWAACCKISHLFLQTGALHASFLRELCPSRLQSISDYPELQSLIRMESKESAKPYGAPQELFICTVTAHKNYVQNLCGIDGAAYWQ